MTYTIRDLVEKATVNEVGENYELYKIDGHIISLRSVTSRSLRVIPFFMSFPRFIYSSKSYSVRRTFLHCVPSSSR